MVHSEESIIVGIDHQGMASGTSSGWVSSEVLNAWKERRVLTEHVVIPRLHNWQVESIADRTQQLLIDVVECRDLPKAEADMAKKRKLIRPE